MTANSNPNSMDSAEPLVVGIDWADSKHDLTVIDGPKVLHFRITSDTEDVAEMIDKLTAIADGRPIAVCLEKGRVRIIYHLMLHNALTLYPVDPKQAARYRESFASSGAKDDRRDSYYLARMLQERRADLRPMKPDDPLTRKISLLCQTRRQLVDDKTGVIQQLHAVLKMFFPLLLALPGTRLDCGLKQEILRRSLPGAGAALAPRLLAAMGSDRDRWSDAEELGSYSGILPVTRQSGKTKQVSRRRACPAYLKQTFHEFADCARKHCDWSGAYYRLQRDRGMAHHAAVRKLASRWQRILLSVWKHRQPYDDARYTETMKRRVPELISLLPPCQ
jgi:transposase